MSAPHEQIPAELALALRVLVDESVGDRVYDIREREGMGWEGPRVKAWSDACLVVKRFASPTGPTVFRTYRYFAGGEHVSVDFDFPLREEPPATLPLRVGDSIYHATLVSDEPTGVS